MRMFGTLFEGWKNIITRFIFISGISISLFLVFNSCKKEPDNLGRDLLPSSDNIYVRVDSSTLINSYTISGKRVVSSVNQYYMLGSQKDSIFGFGSASLLTQFHPAYLVAVDAARSLDSLILYLEPVGRYGDTLSELTLRIYEMDETLNPDSSYYTDINPSEYFKPADEIAVSTFTPGDTMIRVKITDPRFISKFETLPDSVFEDVIDFAANFNGIYLSVDQVADKGGFVYLDMSSNNTRLIFYYNGDTISQEYEMAFTTYAAKANSFTHDYSGFPVNVNLNAADAHDSLIYIEGLAGASGRLSFPELDKWKSKGLIAINKAELILPIDTLKYPSLSPGDYPPQLLLFSLGDDGAYQYLYDYRVDQTGAYYNGNYNSTLKAYVFNIGLHLQSYIDGKLKNSDMIIVSRQSNSTANRIILKGATSEASPIFLKVIYTELF